MRLETSIANFQEMKFGTASNLPRSRSKWGMERGIWGSIVSSLAGSEAGRAPAENKFRVHKYMVHKASQNTHD